jgi:PIN domain nuclease of toxin-antitoxin system
MRILLDTCTFLWITTDAVELTNNARQVFTNPENIVFLSCVSVWEIMVKNSIGKLPLPNAAVEFITEQRVKHEIETLALTEMAIFHLQELPRYHQDPFDRMLICQAIEHDLTILTNDNLIKQYSARTIW